MLISTSTIVMRQRFGILDDKVDNVDVSSIKDTTMLPGACMNASLIIELKGVDDSL